MWVLFCGGRDMCQLEVVVNGTCIRMWRHLDLSKRTVEPTNSIFDSCHVHIWLAMFQSLF